MIWPRLSFSLLYLLLAPAALAADLAIGIREVGTPFYQVPNDFVATVTNHGPDAATAVVLTLTSGASAPPQSADARCTQTAALLRCELGSIAANDKVELRFRALHRDNVAAPSRLEAAVTSSTADPNADNNHHLFLFIPVYPAAEIVTDINFPPAFADDGTLTIRYDITNQHPDYPANLVARIHLPPVATVVRTNANCSGTASPLSCTLTVPPSSTFPLDVTIRLPEPNGRLTTTVEVFWTGYEGLARRDERYAIYIRDLFVTSTADSGPGSLREAILEVNAKGADAVPTRIHFAIAEPVPSTGWFTIRPLTPLPAVTAPNVTIDATTQTARSGDTNPLGPEVLLDGSAAGSGSGFFMRGESWSVSGFAIGNFPENAIYGIPLDIFRFGFTIENNHIGVDPTGTRAIPNTRGIMIGAGSGRIAHNVIGGHVYSGVFLWSLRRVEILENRIGVAAAADDPIPNGSSGVFVGSTREGHFSFVDISRNVIANNGHFGVAYPRLVYATVVQNRIFGNGLGAIDIDLDGPSPEAAPMPRITRAYWDGLATVIEGTVPAQTVGPVSISYSVLLYANSELEPDGYAEAEQPFGTAEPDAFGRFTLRYSGDLRGRYVNGIAFIRTNYYGEFTGRHTSEMGEAVGVDGE